MTITSKGNSLVLSEKREQDGAGLDGLICITSACSAFFLLHALICFLRSLLYGHHSVTAMVLGVVKSHQDLWLLLLMAKGS